MPAVKLPDAAAPSSFVSRLVAGNVLVCLVVVAIIGLLLWQTYTDEQEQAEVTSRNLSQVLEKAVDSLIGKTEVSLYAIADEASRRRSSGTLDGKVLNEYLDRLQSRLPEIDALRVTDEQGTVRYGRGVPQGTTVNLADRDFFRMARDNPVPMLHIGSPVMARISKKWVLPIALRVNNPDGSFWGVVYANIALDSIATIFSSVEIGRQGAVALFDQDLGIIVRYPAPNGLEPYVGKKYSSPQIQKLFREGRTHGTYAAASSVDGIVRTFSYRKVSRHGLYVIVGLGRGENLASWRNEVVKTSVLAGLFVLILASFSWLLARAWKKQVITAEALRQSEQRYRAIVEDQTEFVNRYVAGGVITYANAALARFAGVKPDELIGKSFFPFVHEDDRVALISTIESLSADSPVAVTENRVVLPNGMYWHQWTHCAITDSSGAVIEYQAVGRDITEQRRAEQLLGARVRLSAYALANSLDDLLRFTLDEAEQLTESRIGFFHFLEADQQTLSLQMWSTNTLRHMCTTEGHGRHYPVEAAGVWVDCIHERRPVIHNDYASLPHRKGYPEGHAPVVREVVVPVFRGDTIQAILGVGNKAMDYTQRDVEMISQLANMAWDIVVSKQAEEALRRSESFVREVLDSVDEGFLVVDRNFRIITANRSFCRWAESDYAALVGRPCHEVIHRSPLPCHEAGMDCAVMRVFETGEPHVTVHRHEDSSGHILYVESKAYPLKDASGTVTSAIETITNITERHLLEAEQLKNQKLEAIGTLAGGIAHDFNNLLQGVFGYMSLAKLSLDDRQRAQAMLEQAERALNLSINLTTQLLTFSKGGKPLRKRVALPPVIETAARFALSGSHSDMRLRVSEGLRDVEADEGQIGQVIQNIVLNASESMPGGGVVEISTENVSLLPAENPALPSGGRFVRISIKDSGLGIAEQYLPRIFDPYFTTKQKGSGLGLATSFSIVRNHGGTIEVESSLGVGSTFSIYLPVAESPERVLQSAPPAAAGRSLRVLVMDDEDMVRKVAAEMISSLGHTAACVENGEEAVAACAKAKDEGQPFDVVILDLTVKGGLGGEQVIRQLLDSNPAIRAVVSSGYADSPVVAEYRSYGFSSYLNKPYRIDALRDCLNGLTT